MKGDPAEATCSSRGHDRWDNAEDALSCRYDSVAIARSRITPTACNGNRSINGVLFIQLVF